MKISKNSSFYKILCLDQIIASFALIVLVAVTFLGVIMRYFFNAPFVWLEEVQLLCFIWLIFFGSPVVVRNGGHVAIDIVVDMMPEKLAKIVIHIATIVLILVVGFMCYQGILLIMQHQRTGRVSNILDIPYVVIYSAMPISFMLFILNLLILPFIESDTNDDESKEVNCE